MERYAIFMYELHYPLGGWKDFKESFDDLTDAKSYVAGKLGNKNWCRAHIVDIQTGTEVWDMTNE